MPAGRWCEIVVIGACSLPAAGTSPAGFHVGRPVRFSYGPVEGRPGTKEWCTMSKRKRRVLLVLLFAFAGVGLCLIHGCNGIADPVARQAFLDDLGTTSLTVYPAYVRRRPQQYDEVAAARLAEFLGAENLAEVVVSDEQVPITGPWHRSQPTMLRESAEAFAAYLGDHPIQTDYALLPEYLFGREKAGGIHCYVLDREGTLAYVVLLNDHWPRFSRVDPRTVDDCTDVLIDVLGDAWSPADEGGS
jgi:hypothetical protein